MEPAPLSCSLGYPMLKCANCTCDPFTASRVKAYLTKNQPGPVLAKAPNPGIWVLPPARQKAALTLSFVYKCNHLQSYDNSSPTKNLMVGSHSRAGR
ncbi:hypothetical protein MRB53_030022 [Persea americana]|uniref:Uncharacterized protein n=1 Tax=Persea americana TaxID=3435 RepID=A0ACC2KKN3_PERAE|nr:hypothetical protein MRB53_030022 [Persea americana]